MISVAFTVAVILVAIVLRGIRPWPELTPHAYRCHECRTGFSDVRAIAWHRQGQHVETYDSKERS